MEGNRRKEKERKRKRRKEKERLWKGADGEGEGRKMEREGNVRRGKGGSMIHLFIIFYSPIHLYHHKLELNSIHF